MKPRFFLSVATMAVVACGGGESADTGAGGSGAGASTPPPVAALPAPPSGPMTIPDWFHVDNAARTVRMVITAGATPDNNHWNFNGATKGSLAITVPEGYTVSVELTNHDPNMAHSFGVSLETTSFAVPPTPTPVFAGAISQNPGSMIDGTMPGETETITFVAERAGKYSIVCYIPGHTAIGMWMYFNVSTGGEVGVQTR